MVSKGQLEKPSYGSFIPLRLRIVPSAQANSADPISSLHDRLGYTAESCAVAGVRGASEARFESVEVREGVVGGFSEGGEEDGLHVCSLDGQRCGEVFLDRAFWP